MTVRAPLDAAGFASILPVSRETLERLTRYLDLLVVWQRRINLVGASTLDDPWRRHILDSAQLIRFCPPNSQCLVDLGSGAGLPGLVMAILGIPEVHLIESDQRKAAFMVNAIGLLDLPARIHICRIEAAPPIGADIITARALAPLVDLLPLAERFIRPATRCLFLKGRTASDELTAIKDGWMMRSTLHPSLTSDDAAIIQLDEVARGVSGGG